MMQKFSDPKITAKGEQRAWVDLKSLKTLWFNTGTQCNLACENCYIESSPTNDRLAYLTLEDLKPFLLEKSYQEVQLVGFTGGEPFLNPQIISLMEQVLASGKSLLVLTNAYRVLKRYESSLTELKQKYQDQLHLRISLDHFTQEIHEGERGAKTFDPTLERIKWLFDRGFNISIAGRALASENIEESRVGYSELLESIGVKIDLHKKLVVFPEMIAGEDVPEITTACWDILNKSPDGQMCASERMIVRRKEDAKPVVLPCTLLAYDKQFELGDSLDTASKQVYLNHEFCAKFCVLGGSSCSATM